MTSPNGLLQQRIAVGVYGVHVRSCVYENLHDFRVTSPNGLEQQRIAIGVYGVHVRSCVYENLHDSGMVPPNGCVYENLHDSGMVPVPPNGLVQQRIAIGVYSAFTSAPASTRICTTSV